jgi:U3 small nucleolar RNA-associated protein 20
LSEDFTKFARKIDALCDNLPQVLHHQDKIVETLLECVESSSAVSAEPFLDLVAHLAQDLQAQFAEKHFERTVKTVAAVAARHQEVEVVEWCFNCLTWLFKYLERILAQDIRPLYDLLAPYLGKERQKPFVSRFAAESLSFLVKRVGKRKDATVAFVRHALTDLESTAKEKDAELYERSLIALFLEALKSVKESLHSTGPTIFSALLDETLAIREKPDASEATPRVIREVFHQLIHHTSAENLELLLDIIYAAGSSTDAATVNESRMILTSQLLLLAVSVKSGHRVANWSNLLKHLGSSISLLTQAGPTTHRSAAMAFLATLAVAHQRCPLDAALSSLSTLDKVATSEWQAFFPGFCNLYAEQGADRFKSFLLSRLQKFLVNEWDGVTIPLAVLVPKLVREGAVTPRTLRLADGLATYIEGRISLLKDWHAELGEDDAQEAAEFDGLLAVLDAAAVPNGGNVKVLQELLHAVQQWLARGEHSLMRSFILGDGFLHLSQTPGGSLSNDSFESLSHLFWEGAGNFRDQPAFFIALAAFMKKHEEELQHPVPNHLEKLQDSLLEVLASPSHETRLAALEILHLLIPADETQARTEMASAIEIESTEPSIETARLISMQLKNLGMHYKSYCSSNALLAKAIPRWLFGLLHVKFAQVWEDACAALKEIAATKEGEESICEVAFRWLEHAPLRDEAADEGIEGSEAMHSGYYFDLLSGKIVESLTFAERADQILRERFEERHQRVPMLSPFNRSQALRVLKAVPHLAEKHSRQLVPVLLSWNGDTTAPASDEVEVDDATLAIATTEEPPRWPRKDQKALLGLFAVFNNPKVLYKSEEVYDTLLTLLAHGDAEVQREALKAVLAWKDKTLKKHADDLTKFLDNDRLREQLSVFLDSEANGEGGLPTQDRGVVMPIVLRLVYGRLVARSRNERESGRKAVFVILAKFSPTEVNVFLDVVLAPLAAANGDAVKVPIKRQIGMLNMLKNLLETWQSTAAPYVARLAPAVFACLLAEREGETATALTKAVKGASMQCLNLLFEAGAGFEWEEYMPALFERIVEPRMEKFAEENAQGVSALMRMFGIWAGSGQLVRHLFTHEEALIAKIVGILELAFAKEVVKRFVLNEVLRPLIAHAESDEQVEVVARKQTPTVLRAIAVLLDQAASKEVVEDAVTTVTTLLPYTDFCPPALLSSAAKLVQQPSKKVPHHTKTELLAIISHFFPSLFSDTTTQNEVFSAICASFAYFTDGASRSLLVQIAQRFAKQDGDLDEVIALLDGINAFVPGRLDLPDFDRRAEAFGVVTDQKWRAFSAKQWRLLLGNLLFYIKDEEELAIRASASHALRRFVEASATKEGEEGKEMKTMLQSLLASIEAGLKDRPELVQIEFLSVLAEIARLPEPRNPIHDFHHLLMSGDEEANLFNNILHVQQHRRVRAMNRLSNVAAESVLSSRNLYHYLFPLLEGFVFKSGDGVLMAEAMKALGNLVEWLDWQQFRALARKYVGWVKSKEEKQETVLKLLDGVVSGFARSAALRTRKKPEGEQDEEMDDADEVPAKVQTKLAKTMPGPEKMAVYIIEDVIPPLSVFLREKDESFVSRRISVALIAAKFVHLLPELDFQVRFPPLLTDVCNILRSKDQGSRDMTRRALSSMCTLIGASSFGFILKELRTALQRGFYLHVLAFSVHSILESTISNFQPGELDYCVEDIVDVVVEDVFGNTGKEKDMQEYKADKNTKKEVKGKKSFDTMQLVASVTSLEHLVQLVRPLQALLVGSLSVKEVKYVDDLLRSVEQGVLQNPSLKNRDVLRFCYEIIQEAHAHAPVQQRKPEKRSSAGLVESAYLKPAPRNVSRTSLHKSEASGKIVRFAFEMVRKILKKNKDLLTAGNISGFMPIIGDALLSPNEDVKLAAIRLFTDIINVPLPRIDEDAPVYIAEAAKIVEEIHSPNSELEPAALKLISAVLRERKSAPVKVRAKTISILLKRLKGDLQNISQQGAAFNLLRSIIGRQIIVPELYELMDGDEGVAAISVRDHDRTTRDLARSVYFQFLMDCPQGEKRWKKQLAFLRGNLEFEYAEGRKSVMDTVHLLLSKTGQEQVVDVIRELFWPLVSVMVNDADADCREMAARLVKRVFQRADDEWLRTFTDLTRKMLQQGNAVHKRTALQSWRLYLEVKTKEAEAVDAVLDSIRDILAPADFDGEQWQLVYWALQTFAAIAQTRQDEAFAKGTRSIWVESRRYINFPHLWVKQEATTLVSTLLKLIITSDSPLDTLPLAGPGTLKLEASEVCELASRHLRLLKDGMTSELANIAVRNLAFFGKVFALSGIEWHAQGSKGVLAVQESEEAEEEFQGLSGGEDAEEEDETANDADAQTALEYLLSQLGAIIRRELGKATTPGPRQDTALIPKTAALQLLSAMCNTLPDETLQASATTILSPLIHLTSPDRSIPAHVTQDFKATHEELVKNATELQDSLREKLGTSTFVKVLQKVQGAQRERREERRAKRKVDAVVRPEVMARKKAKRVEREKERKREKNEFHRGKRRGW